MTKHGLLFIFLSLLLSCTSERTSEKDYHFDEKGIRREVLENYLERSITVTDILVPRNGKAQRDDDIRMIKHIGAKFLGRAILTWEGEDKLLKESFWNDARAIIDELHAYDPDIIFQACLFEAISEKVNLIRIPAWVFESYGLEPEERNFNYAEMLNKDGKFVDHWHKGGSVPDISRMETKLWFQYLACSYINIGCEAFHLGQIELMGMNDPEKKHWFSVVGQIRRYAASHARRHWVVLDAHTPKGGMVVDGKSLIDFNSFPMRIRAVPTREPWKEGEAQTAELKVGHTDALYTKSKGCITPTGWSCEHLPYLVEIDNFGREKEVDIANPDSYFCWGWDEISWYAKQPEAYRNEWLVYVTRWMRETDPDGHIEMPGIRPICCPNQTNGTYRANTRSEACPHGYNQEETIRAIWKGEL